MEREYIQEVNGLPGRPGSAWLDRDAKSYPAISGDHRFDVVVVGAGIVGALTAMHLAGSGASVAVIERRRIGAGATGHSTAKLTAQHAAAWGRLLILHGANGLMEYAAQNARAASEVSAMVQDRGIECDLLPMPSYLYASDSESAERLEQEAEAYRQLALPGALQPAPRLPIDVHGSVLLMPDQAVFDAAAFVVGVVRDLEPHVTIAEDTPVRSVEETDHGIVLRCDGATLRTESVVTATHAPLLDTAALFARLYPYRSYALAFRTKSSLPVASWIPAERDSGLTLRPLGDGSDGRWIGSGVDHKAGQGGDERECYRRLAGLVRERFPDAEFLYHWSTQDGMTADGLPFVGRLPSTRRIFLATGFAAWGMTKGVVAARLLADLVAGRASVLQDLLDPGRVEPLKDLREFVSENINVGGRVLRDILSRPGMTEGTSGLEVRREGGRRSAVQHESDGSEQVRNAHCTHMGCVVEVNEAEVTWDCPCHGSRFDRHGSVLEGPAREDLHLLEGKRGQAAPGVSE